MRPLREGWTVFYRRDTEGVADECLNRLCVVRTTEGATYLKEVRRGYSPGHYNLLSWAAGSEPIEDVSLEWAARVAAIVPSP